MVPVPSLHVKGYILGIEVRMGGVDTLLRRDLNVLRMLGLFAIRMKAASSDGGHDASDHTLTPAIIIVVRQRDHGGATGCLNIVACEDQAAAREGMNWIPRLLAMASDPSLVILAMSIETGVIKRAEDASEERHADAHRPEVASSLDGGEARTSRHIV